MSIQKHCIKCNYKWIGRQANPKACPRCHARLDYPSEEDSDIKEIVAKFESTEIKFFFDENGEASFDPINIAEALGYISPQQSVDRILERNADHFVGHLKAVPTVHGVQSESRLSETGMYFFIMCSRQSVAKNFKLWAAEKLTELRKESLSLTDPDQQELFVAQQLVSLITAKIEHSAKIDEVSNKVLFLEERTEELAAELFTLTSKQCRSLQHKANRIVGIAERSYPSVSKGKIYGTIWGLLKDQFEVNSYSDVPKEKYDEAYTFLDCLEKLTPLLEIDYLGYASIAHIRAKCKEHKIKGSRQTSL